MNDDSQLILGPDGSILAASGQFSSDLVDCHLEDCDALPSEIRDAGAALVRRLHESGLPAVARIVARGDSQSAVQLIALEAVPIRRRATDVRALLQSKLGVLAFQAGEAGIELATKVWPGVPAAVLIDADKVAWVVTTLVGNALRYIPSRSRRLGGHHIDVEVGYDAATSTLTVAVRDDGPGIPADTIARLFKHDGLNVRGAGLSLLMIHDVMAAHGGGIDVRSSTDPTAHGTTVRLTIPAHR